MTLGSAVAAYWTPKTVAGNTSWANGGTITDISTSSWGNGTSYAVSVALAVNNSGQVVCRPGALTGITTADIYQIGTGHLTPLTGLLFSCPRPTLLKTLLDSAAGFQNCIDTAGDVVGYEVVSSVNHAAIWQNGTLTDLQAEYGPSGLNILPTNFVMNNATAIDNHGDIAGYGTDGSGHIIQAFVLVQPVPEPSAVLLAATGLVGLLAYAWRKRK